MVPLVTTVWVRPECPITVYWLAVGAGLAWTMPRTSANRMKTRPAVRLDAVDVVPWAASTKTRSPAVTPVGGVPVPDSEKVVVPVTVTATALPEASVTVKPVDVGAGLAATVPETMLASLSLSLPLSLPPDPDELPVGADERLTNRASSSDELPGSGIP